MCVLDRGETVLALGIDANSVFAKEHSYFPLPPLDRTMKRGVPHLIRGIDVYASRYQDLRRRNAPRSGGTE